MNISKDSALFAAYPDALVRAKDSYMKAQEFDSKGSYAHRKFEVGLGQVQMAASNTGIGKYNTGNLRQQPVHSSIWVRKSPGL